MPSADPVMVSHRARAAAQAASIAARLVESEKVCKEYAMAFFPAEARVEGILFWDMILELASKATAQPIETSVPAPVKAPAANSAGVLSKPISFSTGMTTEEAVQDLDDLAEIRSITCGQQKKSTEHRRSFTFLY